MRIVGVGALLFVATAILCCSSSDDSPGATTPDDGGTNPDVIANNDAGTDGNVTTTGTADFVNGSRLHAIVYETNGVQLFFAIHDTKLDITCAFRTAEDGKLRCLPSEVSGIDQTLFADGTCTGQRAYLLLPGCTVPKMADLGYPQTCGAGVPVHRIGALTDAVKAWVRPDGTTDCNETTETGYDIYTVGDAVPASEFVEGTFDMTPVADGLGVRRVKGEDGSSQVWSAWDVARNAPCELGGRQGATKSDRCVPTRIAFEESIFSDMSCTTVAAYAPSYSLECTAPISAVLREGLPDQCGNYEAKYNEVGAKVTTTPLYRKGVGNSCNDANVTGPDAQRYYGLGADLPLTSLPATTDKDEGAGPVKLRSLGSSSGARIMGRVFYDSDHKVECTVMRGADGELRCLPPAVTGTQVDYFSDIDCTKPLINAPAGCTPPAFAHLMSPDTTTCKGPTVRYFSVGAKVTPAKVYQNFHSPNCSEQPLPPGDLYDAATEIAPSAFAAVTKKTL